MAFFFLFWWERTSALAVSLFFLFFFFPTRWDFIVSPYKETPTHMTSYLEYGASPTSILAVSRRTWDRAIPVPKLAGVVGVGAAMVTTVAGCTWSYLAVHHVMISYCVWEYFFLLSSSSLFFSSSPSSIDSPSLTVISSLSLICGANLVRCAQCQCILLISRAMTTRYQDCEAACIKSLVI